MEVHEVMHDIPQNQTIGHLQLRCSHRVVVRRRNAGCYLPFVRRSGYSQGIRVKGHDRRSWTREKKTANSTLNNDQGLRSSLGVSEKVLYTSACSHTSCGAERCVREETDRRGLRSWRKRKHLALQVTWLCLLLLLLHHKAKPVRPIF